MSLQHDQGGHDQGGHDQGFGRAFAIGVLLNTAFVVLEAGAGIWADSLALLADAGHNLGDVMGLLLAWAASYLAQWQPTQKHTYGLRKASVLAALGNALFLLVGTGAIGWEAFRRLRQPADVEVPAMIAVATVGIAINTATALLFVRGRKADLNIRGVFLHMLADAAISAGVVLAGLLIGWTGVMLIDPLLSIVIAAVIFLGAWNLLREALSLALDAVPENVDVEAVQAYLRALPGVVDVHHLHIWALSTTDVALTAHVVLAQPDLSGGLLAQIRDELHDRYRIAHATIQFESHADDVCLTRSCSLRYRR